MTPSVADLDAMSARDAASALSACCGAGAWVSAMLASRPFCSRERVFRAMDDAFDALEPHDWLEAFAHHPQIGGQHAAAPVSSTAAAWSTQEQAVARSSRDGVQEVLARANVEYQRRFGFIFIICASGRRAGDILAALRERLQHERAEEVRIAAREQRAITCLRLDNFLATAHRGTASTNGDRG